MRLGSPAGDLGDGADQGEDTQVVIRSDNSLSAPPEETLSHFNRSVDGLRERVRIIAAEIGTNRFDLAKHDLRVLIDLAAEFKHKIETSHLRDAFPRSTGED